MWQSRTGEQAPVVQRQDLLGNAHDLDRLEVGPGFRANSAAMNLARSVPAIVVTDDLDDAGGLQIEEPGSAVGVLAERHHRRVRRHAVDDPGPVRPERDSRRASPTSPSTARRRVR